MKMSGSFPKSLSFILLIGALLGYLFNKLKNIKPEREQTVLNPLPATVTVTYQRIL